MNNNVWVFHGVGGRFASAVFSSKEKAERWIKSNNLEGILTKYPVDISVYDWAIENNHFTPKKEDHSKREFIQKFTSAMQEHSHYEDEE